MKISTSNVTMESQSSYSAVKTEGTRIFSRINGLGRDPVTGRLKADPNASVAVEWFPPEEGDMPLISQSGNADLARRIRYMGRGRILWPEEEHNLVGQVVSSVTGYKETSATLVTNEAGAAYTSQTQAAGWQSMQGYMGGKGINGLTFIRSGSMEVTQSASFSAQGVTRTEDGREIAFDVDVEMTASFMQRYSKEVFRSKDWLREQFMIGVHKDVDSIPPQKFLFDYDPESVRKVLSFLSLGEGYLMLDGNKDGKLNGLHEMVGGRDDAFTELARFDEDKNGWIDENDSVFDNLMVWSKNNDGKVAANP